MCGFDWYWSTNLSAIHWNVTSYLAFTCYNICCWFIKPPYYRIMDNLTLNGELEHTLVLSLVEEIEVAAAIIIVFLVRYLAIWDGFLFIYVKLLIWCRLRNIRKILQLSGKSAAPLFSHLSISPHLHWLLGRRVVAIHRISWPVPTYLSPDLL